MDYLGSSPGQGNNDGDIGSPEMADVRRGIAFTLIAFISTGFAVWAAFDLGTARGWMRVGLDLVLIIVGLLPYVWLAAKIRRWLIIERRVNQVRCVSCGYPIKGTVGTRCPECGKSPFAPLD